MDVNKTLVLTLRQDILSINRLLEEISKDNQLCPTNSWLFPTKPYNVLSATILSQGLEGYSYEKCLEILVDRLYVLINLILQHLKKEKRSSTPNLIIQPLRSSLGTSIKLIWDCIVKLANTKVHLKKMCSVEGLMDRAAQTDITALNKCDSCSSAISCMKSILRTFESQKDRINIKYQILNITQFGSMLKATSSIEEALQNVYQRLHNESRDKEKLNAENEKLRNRIKGFESKIDILEEEVRVLRKEFEKGGQEIMDLKEEKTKLSSLITNQNKNIIYLEKNLDNRTASFQLVSKENSTLKLQNKTLELSVEKSIHLLRNYNKSLNKKLLMIDEELSIIKSILEQYDISLIQINARLVRLAKNVGKIELKVIYKLDPKETLQQFNKCEDFCVKIKELFKDKMEKSKPPEILSVKGNPVEDISRQIEDNKSKISVLENENVRLEVLLDRFKHLQRK